MCGSDFRNDRLSDGGCSRTCGHWDTAFYYFTQYDCGVHTAISGGQCGREAEEVIRMPCKNGAEREGCIA